MKHKIKNERLIQLIKEGRKAARLRGHQMRQVYPSRNSTLFNGFMFQAKCDDCDAFLTCNAKPMPNEIPVGGSAVAVNCTGVTDGR